MPEIVLPELHSGQVDIYNRRTRFNAVRCGRRWGKTVLITSIAGDRAMMGRKVGIFAPEHKQLIEPFEALVDILGPAVKRKNASEGSIYMRTGGKIDFWPLIDNPRAGRGREYHDVLIDEAAFTKSGQMLDIWNKAIKPTLLTTRGAGWAMSTPNGADPDNFFYRICTEPGLGWHDFHAPTASNPYVPADELELMRQREHPLVWQQEYLAEFVDWASAAFFKLEYFLRNGLPVPYPTNCDAVFAILDCAVKSGTANDATAVLYCAVNPYGGLPLIWLDYELHSIEAASLEYLAPKIMARCEELAKQCGARQGSLGLLVEDAAGGSVLIQQAGPRGWPIRPLDMALTMKGKDERCMIAGGPAYRGDVAISEHAFNKVVDWRGRQRNHLTQQVTTFRIGDKDAAKRADDLLDCAAYSIIVACVDERMAG